MAYTGTISESTSIVPDANDIRYVDGPLKDYQIKGAATPSRVPLFGDSVTSVVQNTNVVALPGGSTTLGTKTITEGPIRWGVWWRQNYAALGPAHGRTVGRWAITTGGNAMYGQIGFADAHVEKFKDVIPDGKFSYDLTYGYHVEYDELAYRVFAGWLNRPGLDF
jgi:hypothetical protein